MAYRGPAGLPGVPENIEDFVRCAADEGIMFYIASDIWESLAPSDKELAVSVEGYGRFVLDLDVDADLAS